MNATIAPFKVEIRVVIVVLAALAAMETALRLNEGRISSNIRERILTLPRKQAAMNAAPQQRHGLFLGNSLTLRGVNMERVERDLKGGGLETIRWDKAAPDATTIADWHYITKNYFSTGPGRPRVIVLGFAIGHLQDGTEVWHRRLGRYFTRLADTPEVFGNDVPGYGDRVEFLLSKVSSVLGNRRNIRQRLLEMTIPYYEQAELRINAVANRNLRQGFIKPDMNYSRLERFMAMLKAADIRLLTVAMPSRDPYEIDPKLIKTLEAGGVKLLDARKIPGLSAEHFMDFYHVNEKGSEIYTDYLIGRLKEPELTEYLTGAFGESKPGK